jgi:replicative DNA helicase
MSPPDDWPVIVPLSGSGTPDPFPIEALPQGLRRMVVATAAATATPVDLPACVALGVLAVLAPRGLSIRPTGTPWTPPANLYVAVIAKSGESKTPVYRELLAPVVAIEAEWQEAMRDEILEARTRKAIAEQQAEKAMRDVSQGKPDRNGNVPSVTEALDLAKVADAIQVPPTPRLFTPEATPEALVRVCGVIGGTFAVVSDEGAEVFQLMSRYSSSGTANLGIYLSGYEGDQYTSDRATREPIHIDRLVLSVVLAIQPVVLDDLAAAKANRDRGLLPRFLWSMPTSQVGSRPTRRPDVPVDVRSEWTALVRRLADQVNGRTEPVVLEVDDEAQGIWWSWCETVEPRLHPDTGDLRQLVDWGNKHGGHVARLAALLHVGGGRPFEEKVSGSTMRSAITLWHYFADHAKCVFATMEETPDVRLARKVLHWIERNQRKPFSQRDAWRGTQGGIVETTEDVKTGLAVLVGRGYLRPAPTAKTGRAGRPTSPTFAVNPALATANNATNPPGFEHLDAGPPTANNATNPPGFRDEDDHRQDDDEWWSSDAADAYAETLDHDAPPLDDEVPENIDEVQAWAEQAEREAS